MSLRVAVAAPFKSRGEATLAEQAFVVALSLERDWCAPDEAEAVVEAAIAADLLERDGDQLAPAFDPAEVAVPTDFEFDPSALAPKPPFERALEALVEAGHEKRDAVAAINDLQQRLRVTSTAAAVLYARRQGLDVRDVARTAVDR